jgi:hypothetical protein
MMTGCSAKKEAIPTSEEVRAIVPQRFEFSKEDYPLLKKPAPTLEEAFAQIPKEYHTFTFDESKWIKEADAAEEKKSKLDLLAEEYLSAFDYIYYVPADGSKGTELIYDQESDYYEILIGVKEDADGWETYDICYSYNSKGELDYYTNNITGFELYMSETPGEYEITVTDKDNYYTYCYEFGKLDCVSIFYCSAYEESKPDSGFSFYYYPEHDALREISYDYTVDTDKTYVSYTASYNNNGDLEYVNYDSNRNYAGYDSNYQVIEEETDYYSFFDQLIDMYF